MTWINQDDGREYRSVAVRRYCKSFAKPLRIARARGVVACVTPSPS